jgi:hypothetical protein
MSLEKNKIKMKQWAQEKKEALEEIYSEIAFSFEFPDPKAPHESMAGGYKGHPLISFWDYSSNFQTTYVVSDNDIQRVW